MKTWLSYLLALLMLVGSASGCGGDRDKGINKDKDKPKREAK